jgi:hypothetical protein
MAKKFQVFGDYGLHDECMLEDFDQQSEAVRWAKQYCRRDMGGYESIDVISFMSDGEAVTHFRKTIEDE